MDFGTNIRFPVYQMRSILVKVSLSMVKNLSVSEISIFYRSFKNISKKGISLLILFFIKNYYHVVRHKIVFFLIAKYIIRFTHSFLFQNSTVIFVHIS